MDCIEFLTKEDLVLLEHDLFDFNSHSVCNSTQVLNFQACLLQSESEAQTRVISTACINQFSPELIFGNDSFDEDITLEDLDKIHFVPFNILNEQDKVIKKRGRHVGTRTNKCSPLIQYGSRVVKKDSADYQLKLEKEILNVRAFREKKANEAAQLAHQGDENYTKCEECNRNFKSKFFKMHKSKCLKTHQMIKCELCERRFKALGLKNHKKLCEQLRK